MRQSLSLWADTLLEGRLDSHLLFLFETLLSVTLFFFFFFFFLFFSLCLESKSPSLWLHIDLPDSQLTLFVLQEFHSRAEKLTTHLF
jgi:hypothetical protein